MLFTKIISILAVTTTALAAPLTTRQSSDPQCINGSKKVFLPDLFNIYIYPNVAPFPSTATALNVMKGSSSGSEQQQVARWQGIPTTATTCTIGWAMTADRAFSVYDNGLVRFQQMLGLPDPNVTVDTIKDYENPNGKTGSMDFTFWPETTGPRFSIGGPVDCGSQVVVKLWKDVIDGGNGSVTMEQNAANGLFLSYNC